MDRTVTTTTTVVGDLTTIAISGYLSGACDETLAPAFAAVGNTPRILVAFAPDAFLNSAGIAVLLARLLPLRDQGREVRLVHPAAHFRRVFTIVGLSADVPVFADAASAVADW